MKNPTSSLNDLASWLSAVLPELLAELNPPASSGNITRLAREFGGSIPVDVRVLLSWHSGGPVPDPWWELSEMDECWRYSSFPSL